jgi:homoserine dehydrogenase
MSELAIGLLGRGNVGSELLSQLKGIPNLKVVAVSTRREPQPVLDLISDFPRAVLVDCTAADGQEKIYARAFHLGVHVVTANKKPLVAGVEAPAGVEFRYETTVGAGLPVIEPLKDLLRTGDEVRRIEGSFSGTLGFLVSELARGVRLSHAVRSAKELGYTEPHPREDLSGQDVARKALILAREVGVRCEAEIEPFVPAHLLQHDDPENFLRALSELDGDFSERVRQQAQNGRVLRYLAEVDVLTRRVRVGPRWVDATHAASQLRGTDSLVTYFTRRYCDTPMRIQGPGAGAAVTAAGVLADILAIERTTASRLPRLRRNAPSLARRVPVFS